eukprot:m.51484 g.51484  ORF g.51484 m.51484 type:complete len:215 (+) comp34148_c0_seq1:276-920(+)
MVCKGRLLVLRVHLPSPCFMIHSTNKLAAEMMSYVVFSVLFLVSIISFIDGVVPLTILSDPTSLKLKQSHSGSTKVQISAGGCNNGSSSAPTLSNTNASVPRTRRIHRGRVSTIRTIFRSISPSSEQPDCSPKDHEHHIVTHRCSKRVKVKKCMGQCDSYAVPSSDGTTVEKSCKCCQPENTKFKEFFFNCGGVRLKQKVVTVTKCFCRRVDCS